VAGMLCSFDYVARAAVERVATVTSGPRDVLSRYALAWRDAATAAFMTAYRESARGMPSYPQEPSEAKCILDLFMLEKSCYELRYEVANRPGWIAIPIRVLNGLHDFLGRIKP
jgi:maltose alpha-D-glucosyltransferase / alpha-amylase